MLGMELSDRARETINQQIEADKQPAAQEPDQNEFEVLEFLGPKVNVPEEKDDNNEEQANIEVISKYLSINLF